MHETIVSSSARRFAAPRRLILGAAFLLALSVWAVPRTPAATAQESKAAADVTAAAPAKAGGEGGGGKSVTINIGVKGEPDAAAGDEGGGADGAAKAGKTAEKLKGRVIVKDGGASIHFTDSPDREYASVGDFLHSEPELAIMIILVVAVVFLSPVLAIGLILLYRMRKVRLQNETMLKLAEKGIVTPAEAIEAVASGNMAMPARTDLPAAAGAGSVPLGERVAALRKSAAWSDLRKGILMGAIGMGLTLYSLFEDRSPNGLGLVLLFVGIGYVVLWWFEERQIAPRNGGAGTSPGAGAGGAS